MRIPTWTEAWVGIFIILEQKLEQKEKKHCTAILLTCYKSGSSPISRTKKEVVLTDGLFFGTGAFPEKSYLGYRLKAAKLKFVAQFKSAHLGTHYRVIANQPAYLVWQSVLFVALWATRPMGPSVCQKHTWLAGDADCHTSVRTGSQ